MRKMMKAVGVFFLLAMSCGCMTATGEKNINSRDACLKATVPRLIRIFGAERR